MPAPTPGARARLLDEQLNRLDRGGGTSPAAAPAPARADQHPEMYGLAAQARQDARMERFGVEPVE